MSRTRKDSARGFIDQALAIQEKAAPKAGELGFMARAMVLATLPHSNPKTTRFERVNGNYRLVMQAMQEGVGLPYGTIPRLFLAWVVTEAVRTKSRTLTLGDSLSDFMRQLDMVPTGGRWGSITRLRDQIGRMLSCAIGIYHTDDEGMQGRQMFVADQYALWWDHKKPNQRSLFDSKIELSQTFFDEIIRSPIPLDMRALKALKKTPLGLDIYMWLTYRLSYLKKPTCIPWASLQAQFGSGYPDTSRGRADFKRKFKAQLRKVQCIIPNIRIETPADGLLIHPGKPHIAAKPKK